MQNWRVVVERIQISTYFVDADCYEEAEFQAVNQAINDDWTNEQAEYLPLSAVINKLPF